MPELILVRGLPGSGKTTFASRLAEKCGLTHLETDFFFEENGTYSFDPSKLATNHVRCQNAARASLDRGCDVIVSNTFSQLWEMQPYLDMGYPVVVITCEGNYGSIHNVPEKTIFNMKKRWEAYP